MHTELFVALEIAANDLADDLLNLLGRIPGVKSQRWAGNLGEKGALAVKTVPEIIVVDDNPSSGDLLTRVRTIKGHFPGTSLFVVSEIRDPQFIIDVMKAGAAEYLVAPVAERIFINAVEEVRVKLVSADTSSKGKIYSFISSKGGVGSTVLAVNTAAAFAVSKKNSVALIDMSLQAGDASVLLDIVPQTSLLDICQNIHRLDIALLRGVMINHNSGLNFLAAPQNPEDSDDVHCEHIASILDLARKLHDYIVVDCSSMHVSECSVEVFRRSDKVFVVTDMSVPSIRNTVRLCKLIRKFGIAADKIEIILNRFIKDSVLSLGEIEKNFDKPLYWIAPNDFTDVVSSINRGIPLVKLTPSAPFSKNIVDFVRKIENLHDELNFRGLRNMFGKSL
ncbi:MAG: hypothetical protein FDZ69_00460 [Deltaproteobacteria bacterium]|nr:MAG: hypothetical protein FDZ69_00460 [Deltaproteobacteria bacterium]